jgi:hypothetical protein
MDCATFTLHAAMTMLYEWTQMRQATFTNRALLALLASFVVGSAVGESLEPTKVRVTTWNLEWFQTVLLMMQRS